MSKLLPELPFEIRAARIGTCYNPLSRSLIYNKIVIDPSRLDLKAINIVKGSASLQLRANASTSKNVCDTFFSLDSKIKAGSWVSVGFNMETSQSDINTNDALNCYCSYVYKGQRVVLQNNGPNSLFNYMTDEFQAALIDLLNTRESTQFFQKYMAFVQNFGYGCITELYLTSGSAFTMNVSYTSKATANQAKYGGSLGIGTPWGGGSVATSFAKEATAADSAASLYIEAEQIPEDTPTRAWSESLISELLKVGLSELTKKPESITPYIGDAPKAPEVPEGKPSEKEIPASETPLITEKLQEELMRQDNFNGSWESYLKTQQQEYDKLKPEMIVSQVCENCKRLLTIPVNEKKRAVSLQPPEMDSIGGGWELGGYIPYDYTITPWTKLFPQLKSMALPTTLTSIYIAKAYVYYLTRMQFASYLYFLVDVGEDICENSNIKFDANNYAEACKQLLDNISDTIMSCSGTFHSEHYDNIVAGFEQNINNMPNFYSKKTYLCFFENYNFFVENSSGFIWMFFAGNHSYYLDTKSNPLPLPEPFSVIGMMEKGLRFYPILTPDAKLKSAIFAGFAGHKFYPAVKIIDGLNAKPKTDSHGFKYYIAEYKYVTEAVSAGVESRFYGSGFSDLKKLKGASIMGRPMITDFDFNSVIQFADPNQPF